MIYECNECYAMFGDLLIKPEHNRLYANGRYTTRHCPYCNSQDFKEHYELYAYDDKFYTEDELYETLDTINEEDFEQLLEDCRIKEWSDF